MAFNLLSLLIPKFRGRRVAVFRDRCTRYEVSRPVLPSTSNDLNRITGIKYFSHRTEQLPEPSRRSHREHRPPICDPRLSQS